VPKRQAKQDQRRGRNFDQTGAWGGQEVSAQGKKKQRAKKHFGHVPLRGGLLRHFQKVGEKKQKEGERKTKNGHAISQGEIGAKVRLEGED